MNRDISGLMAPIVALALFALVASQTFVALRATGAWSGMGAAPRQASAAHADPVAPVEALMAHAEPAAPTVARDPFQSGAAPAPVVHAGPAPVRKPVAPPPPEQPQLTAIVWDSDPRALVHWKGRDWTVRPGGLFDEFQVNSISRDKVVLSRGSETLVLQRKAQGD